MLGISPCWSEQFAMQSLETPREDRHNISQSLELLIDSPMDYLLKEFGDELVD